LDMLFDWCYSQTIVMGMEPNLV